jgi:hypothetical protein
VAILVVIALAWIWFRIIKPRRQPPKAPADTGV